MADRERTRHVLLVNWRDTTHPDGGGSERYVERMARALVERGHRVTVHCAAHENAPADEVIDGVRFRRRGGRLSVYLAAIVTVLRLRPDLVIDTQNGLPFFSPLVARCPVLVLVHHVHKEQWYAYLGHPLGGIGWWIESRLAPILYRRRAYLTVSETTARELGKLGVDRERITVIRCGQDPVPSTSVARAEAPRLVAVSRLVPHKRIEHAIDAVAELRERFPGIGLDVVGCGVWEEPLREYAAKRGVSDAVTLHGWVSEQRKHDLIARSWLHLCPSLKEGWGLAITEAAAHGVPSIAYRAAGGVAESIVDGATGLLAENQEQFIAQIAHLLGDPDLLERFGKQARTHADAQSWEASGVRFAATVDATLAGRSTGQPAELPDHQLEQLLSSIR